jgi:hypothetical protein
MKKVKFVLVSNSRGELDVCNIKEREGEDVGKMFMKFYEEEVNGMRGDFEDEEEFEEYVEEWCECGENYFGVSEESGVWMIEEGSKFWDVENWMKWDDEKWSECEEFVEW